MIAVRPAIWTCWFTAIGALATGALAIGAKPASSGVPLELVKEFQAGIDAYRLGKYGEARGHLDKAQMLDPMLAGPHRFLAAVARAEQHWPECIAEARRALQLNPRSQELGDTRKLHDACRAAAGRPAYRTPLGEAAAIAVTSNVTGAVVRIGGLRYGGTPVAPRRIRPGIHELDIDKDGFRSAHRVVTALPGIVTDIDIELDPDPGLPSSP